MTPHTAQTDTPAWLDELVQRMIRELNLDAVEIYRPNSTHGFDVVPQTSFRFADYVGELTSKQVMELVRSVRSGNSAPVQEALKGLHIDVATCDAAGMVDAAAQAALLLHIAARIARRA